jgi:hypothetical protein
LAPIPAAGGAVPVQLTRHEGPFAPCQSLAGIGGLLSLSPVSSVLMVPHSSFPVHVSPATGFAFSNPVLAVVL